MWWFDVCTSVWWSDEVDVECVNAQCDKRRGVMRQFNADSRIRSLLMSTRTPLIGVDLPDVDVVIFYDVELRPDMSDNVDSFCRRLALTRDVHILRWLLALACVCVMP